MAALTRMIPLTLGALGIVLLPLTVSAEGAVRTIAAPLSVTDYIDCTDEDGDFDLLVNWTELTKATPSGVTNYTANALFEGTLEGKTTGYIWTTKGVLQLSSIYSGTSLMGHEGWLENALLKPETPGAPRMRLDVKVGAQYNALGEPVVNRWTYEYHCVGN